MCANCEKAFPNILTTRVTQVSVEIMPGGRRTERAFHSLDCATEWAERGGVPRRKRWLRFPWRE